MKKCCFCGEPFKCFFKGNPYCNKHYLKMKFYNTCESVRVSKNKFILEEYLTIITSKGEKIKADICDYEVLKKYSWCISKTGYAVANIKGKVTKLHRYILNCKPKEIVDHINRDKLDNTRKNLRICSQKENGKNLGLKINNTSGYPGIRITKNGKFNVRITVDFKEIHIGNFETMEEAIKEKEFANKKYYGEFEPKNILCNINET